MSAVIIADVTIPGEFVALFGGLLLTIGVGITSWALVLLVRTTNLVGKLEERVESLGQRVADLEHGRG